MQIACPACGKKLVAPPELAGKNVKCPACGGGITVPAAAAASPLGPSPANPLGPPSANPLGLGAGASGGNPLPPLGAPGGQLPPMPMGGNPYAAPVYGTPPPSSGTPISFMLGLAAAIVGVGSIVICCMPYFSITICVLALAMGIGGIVLAMQKPEESKVLPIVGTSLAGVMLCVHIGLLLAAMAAVSGVQNFAKAVVEGQVKKLEDARTALASVTFQNTSFEGMQGDRKVKGTIVNGSDKELASVTFVVESVAANGDKLDSLGRIVRIPEGLPPGGRKEFEATVDGLLSQAELQPGAPVTARATRLEVKNAPPLEGDIEFGPFQEERLKKLKEDLEKLPK